MRALPPAHREHAQRVDLQPVIGQLVRGTIENAVDAAAGGVKFDAPAAAPKLGVHRRFRQDRRCRRPGGRFLLRADIAKHAVRRIVRVARRIPQLRNAVFAVGTVLIASGKARRAQLRHAVLRGGVDQLRLAVQLLLPQAAAHNGQRRDRHRRQQRQHGDHDQHLGQRKAAVGAGICTFAF